MLPPLIQQPLKLSELTGYRLNACDGEIGKLAEIYFDDDSWAVRYLVVRTGGWLFGNKVLVIPDVILKVDPEAKLLEVNLTRAQIENCPPMQTTLPISRHYEREYFRYYGWPPYWDIGPALSPLLYPPATPVEPPQEPEHPHLRSSDEVLGYKVQATDGNIGHSKDFILEEPNWMIRYLEIDTRKWLPGKHVLVGTTWISRIDLAAQEVRLDLTREAIKTAPPYDPSMLISSEYQVALYEHYGRKYQART